VLKRFDSGGFADTHPMLCKIQPTKKDGEFKRDGCFHKHLLSTNYISHQICRKPDTNVSKLFLLPSAWVLEISSKEETTEQCSFHLVLHFEECSPCVTVC
jgi:hypothetical protein